MPEPGPVEVVNGFFDAYNVGDDAAMLGFCDEKIHVVHHNRGLDLSGRDAFGELLAGFKQGFPDKRFTDRRALYRDGDTVLVEHTWTGTAVADVPGFATGGETARLDLCTRCTVIDGLIVEWHDYG